MDYDRILINPYNTQDKVETVCLASFGATGSEYRMLIKAGKILYVTYGSRCKQPCLWRYRPGHAHINLLSYSDYLGA